MPNLMRAAVVHAFDQALVIEQVPIPSPGPGQVLVKIEASGVCHTDLHAARGDWPIKPALPFIPGHEGAGFVAALGAGVEGFQEGDRVGIPWLHSACGRCSYCVGGWETLCQAQTNTGYSVNGGFAEYALAEAAYAAPIPATISLTDAAPILCAGVTTYKALKETGARPGEWVLISGIGGLGHMAVQYARAMGLRVVAMDVTKEKLSLAHELGAEIMIDARVCGRRYASSVGDRRSTRCGRYGCLCACLPPGARHGAARRHLCARGPAPGRFLDPYLRRGFEAPDDPWLDRGHAQRSCGGVCARSKRRRDCEIRGAAARVRQHCV